jgi:hypothetical protein
MPRRPNSIPAPRLFSGPLPPELTPVYRVRHDGWTQERQIRFLAVLGHTGCVVDACRVVNISKTSAYRLRKLHPKFAAAWEKAMLSAGQGLEAIAYKRAVEGSETIIFRNGVEYERRISKSDSLLALLIKRGHMNPAAFLPDDEVISRAEHNEGWRFDESTGTKQQLPPMFRTGRDPRHELIAKLQQMRARKEAFEARQKAEGNPRDDNG